MSKHSIEERLAAVQRYLNGEASTFIARQTGIDHHDIIVYALRYQRNGMSGLEDLRRRVWTKEEKLKVINAYLEESLTLEEIAVLNLEVISDFSSVQFSSGQSPSCVRLFATP